MSKVGPISTGAHAPSRPVRTKLLLVELIALIDAGSLEERNCVASEEELVLIVGELLKSVLHARRGIKATPA